MYIISGKEELKIFTLMKKSQIMWIFLCFGLHLL